MKPIKRETEHQIDMAGVIAEREKVTVAGLGGDDKEYSVLLPAKDNQMIADVLGMSRMGKKKIKLHNLKIYAAMIYCLMREISSTTEGVLIIDLDYDKRSIGKAKSAVIDVLKKEGVEVNYRIETKSIGYDGPAHHVCNGVHRGIREPDYILTCEDCLEIMGRFRLK